MSKNSKARLISHLEQERNRLIMELCPVCKVVDGKLAWEVPLAKNEIPVYAVNGRVLLSAQT